MIFLFSFVFWQFFARVFKGATAMENFGLLKFLKSPYPAASKNIAAPHPEKSPENAEKPPENPGKTEKIGGKNEKIGANNAENHSKNGEIYLDFIEKQRNFSRKIPKN